MKNEINLSTPFYYIQPVCSPNRLIIPVKIYTGEDLYR